MNEIRQVQKDESDVPNTCYQKDIAESHARWYANHFKQIVELVYKDAFKHGMKHGSE